MKKIKVSLLALSVLVGGAVLASAAKDSNIIGATSVVSLTNVPAPLVWYDVFTLPTSSPTITNVGGLYVIDTDDGGKISGVANVLKEYLDATNNVVAISSWYATVKGKISASKQGVPSITMSLKGDGYSSTSSNLSFIIPAQVDAFPGKFSLNFSAKSATPFPLPILVGTNVVGTNWHVIGDLKGTITPASKNAKQQKVSEKADLVVARTAMDTLTMRVVLSGDKFGAIVTSPEIYGASGMAKISKGNYKLTLKDPAGGSSSLQLIGTVTGFIDPSSTNKMIQTVNSADIKGKLQGQAVESKGFSAKGF